MNGLRNEKPNEVGAVFIADEVLLICVKCLPHAFGGNENIRSTNI